MSSSTVPAYEAAISGSSSVRHLLSRRMTQPGLSSCSCTRLSNTCSLKATARSASSPPLVTRSVARRMRFPLAPAMLRAGGWISAGMISTVHIPIPIRAAMDPNVWPHLCAPSPESLMTSTMCSPSVTTDLSGDEDRPRRLTSVARATFPFRAGDRGLRC